MASNASNPSPPTSSGSANHSQIPISRPSGAAYETKERARTSHACEPCRERKTKCDGERPSCRRCLATGTGCHYGYGKGWRKRKTAEDLTATSRRLARYEALLNDIMPMVSPNVKAMIEDAREQDAAASTSTGSETTESNEPMHLMGSLTSEMSNSSSNSRVSLPLPIPSPLVTQGPRVPLVRPFESMSPTSSNPIPRPTSQRGSPDDPTATRLPSIRPDGLLIEPAASLPHPRMMGHMSDDSVLLKDRAGVGSPPGDGRMSHGGWSHLDRGIGHADSRKRDFEAAFSPGVSIAVATPG